MPSLIRFLVFCAVIVGLVYGAMFALAVYVEPTPREITVQVPTERVNPR
ncbi:MAG: histidine kinase [Pseudomonadota bacterium]